MKRYRAVLTVVAFLALSIASSTESRAAVEKSSIPDQAFEILAQRIQAMVDNEEIVGGELLVIQNGDPLFRRAFGWTDLETRQPLELDEVYCVRSMTKPLVGTAIQMLIDEGRLALDTPVHEILPSFDRESTRRITVEHLLTHTGGFPFTTIARPLTDYAGLEDVAAEAAATKLLFEPGTQFQYSDAGSDSLGAIVEKITRGPVETFIQKRILDPLGMTDTYTRIGQDESVLARIPAAYSGGTAGWTKHWDATGEPIFPIFLSSQSLYSTTTDYARFLELWMNGGTVGERRLLSTDAVNRALTPKNLIKEYPSGFRGTMTYYGEQWIVYARAEGDADPERVVFGHNGSDGTHAWAWPEHNLMVLFFTQSRGTLAGLGLEPALQTVLIDQKLDDPSLTERVPTQEELEQVAGLYWDETNRTAYYVIKPHGERLSLERPGRAYLIFKATQTPGRFVHEANSRVWIEFERSGDGRVVAMRTVFGNEDERAPRHVGQEDLPSADEVVAMVQHAHNMERLSDLGFVRLEGTMKFESRNMEGTFLSTFTTNRGRTELDFGAAQETIVTNDGRVWSHNSTLGESELEGARREQSILDRIPARFGDWSLHYDQIEVLKRIQAGDDSVLLIRVVPRESFGSTMFVDESTGTLRVVDSLVQIPGVGVVGVRTRYDDFRDVGGVTLPFVSVAEFATPLIGRVVTTIEKAETHVALTEELLSPPVVRKVGE